MSRQVSEWRGKTDDSMPPPRVRLRIFDRHHGICHISGRKIQPGEAWELDHIIALANGGLNVESNLAPALKEKHREKTAADVAEKSRVYRKRTRHIGIKTRKGRPMPGSKASGWKRKMDGTVERRHDG